MPTAATQPPSCLRLFACETFSLTFPPFHPLPTPQVRTQDAVRQIKVRTRHGRPVPVRIRDKALRKAEAAPRRLFVATDAMRLTRTTSDGWSRRARRDFGVIMALTRLSRHTQTTRWSRFALPRARSSDTEGSRERTDTNGLGAGLANAEIWNVLRHGSFLDRCDLPTRAMERRHPAKAL